MSKTADELGTALTLAIEAGGKDMGKTVDAILAEATDTHTTINLTAALPAAAANYPTLADRLLSYPNGGTLQSGDTLGKMLLKTAAVTVSDVTTSDADTFASILELSKAHTSLVRTILAYPNADKISAVHLEKAERIARMCDRMTTSRIIQQYRETHGHVASSGIAR